MKPAKMDDTSAKKTSVENENASLFSHFSAVTADKMTIGMYANLDPKATMNSSIESKIAVLKPPSDTFGGLYITICLTSWKRTSTQPPKRKTFIFERGVFNCICSSRSLLLLLLVLLLF